MTRWDLVHKWADPETRTLVDAVTSALENCDRKLTEAAHPAAPRAEGLDLHTLAGWIEEYEAEGWKHDPDFRDGTDRQVAENIARAILARLAPQERRDNG